MFFSFSINNTYFLIDFYVIIIFLYTNALFLSHSLKRTFKYICKCRMCWKTLLCYVESENVLLPLNFRPLLVSCVMLEPTSSLHTMTMIISSKTHTPSSQLWSLLQLEPCFSLLGSLDAALQWERATVGLQRSVKHFTPGQIRVQTPFCCRGLV